MRILSKFLLRTNRKALTTFTGVLAACVLLTSVLIAQEVLQSSGPYEPTWESLDKHPLPEWYDDAKFGMKIHWGIYSVPAWAPKDSKGSDAYAEWYWGHMHEEDHPTHEYHKETYGVDFLYDEFIPEFTAENFDAEEWISLFEESGAKYLGMITTKHHDGFCLWDTEYTNRNSVDLGPGRDLIGELNAAAKKADYPIGFYYSLYEWFNPIYTGEPVTNAYTGEEIPYTGLIEHDDYISDFMVPQVKELIDEYDPDYLYFDGEWDRDHEAEFWKTLEIAAYFYNQAENRKRPVLINDRLGATTRGKHGDVFIGEYEFGGGKREVISPHKWSYTSGVGKSFGYNKTEGEEHYKSVNELIDEMVDVVSKNGNYLLNLGPRADGTIPEMQKERVLGMGEWLKVNGNAIYESRPWDEFKEGSIRFTQHKAKMKIYAIFLEWPKDEWVKIENISRKQIYDVKLLGTESDVSWTQDSDGLMIKFPEYEDRPCDHAWSVEVTLGKTRD